MLVLAAIGAVVALLSGLVNNSTRRLALMGAVGLLITFISFPFGRAIGFLSRHTLNPTLLGLSPIFPAFFAIAGVAILAVALSRTSPRLFGSVAVLAGVVTIVIALLWVNRGVQLASLLPLNGFMEVVTGLAIFAIFVPFALLRRRLLLPLLLIGAAVGTATFVWLNSPAGHANFPKTEGYYRLLRPTADGTIEAIIVSYNAGLDELNRQRTNVGLNPLEPIDSLATFEEQRLPRAAAESDDPDAPAFRLVRSSDTGYGTPVAFLFAGLLVGGGLMLLWRPRLTAASNLRSGTLLAIVVVILAPAFASTDFSFQRLVEGWPFLRDFFGSGLAAEHLRPPGGRQPDADHHRDRAGRHLSGRDFCRFAIVLRVAQPHPAQPLHAHCVHAHPDLLQHRPRRRYPDPGAGVRSGGGPGSVRGGAGYGHPLHRRPRQGLLRVDRERR